MGWFSSAISSVGSALSSIGSAICSGISNVCSAIGGTAFGKALGNVMTGFANAIGIAAPPLGLSPLRVIVIVAEVICKIAECLGVKEDKKDEPEELAMKAENSDKKPDDFDSTEAYINYIQNQIKLDSEQQTKLKNMTPDERAVYQLTGSYIYMKSCAEKLGLDKNSMQTDIDINGMDINFLIDAYKLGLTGMEIVAYIKALLASGLDNTKYISDFLHGKAENFETAVKVQDSVVSAIRTIQPDISENDIDKKLDELKGNV